MKQFNMILIGAFAIMIASSCKKQGTVTPNNGTTQPVIDNIGIVVNNQNTTAPRKVKYVLYTDQNFSTDSKLITFRLFMQRPNNTTVWDSILPPMKVKDIPKSLHKIVVERLVPGNDPSTLKVGFEYTIQDVGYSWFFDVINAGETFKEVNYSFK
ncbi:hypothetical protein KXQ82_17745 [Mucilaginibacter sp. HMF5004]|uniref:hypothetical protein n=1 Tax=Mucilaginibacter rivuli TaxID=2857527 RepID=UPI001C6048C9|nr:hypothetical protein [Mucilaginibacter rivuli]MBW4891574.1 hypothetical protein [Mucilaginibacter rivuli]